MGTRNLTMVISGGKTKIAQYGQWDGYPSGQGKTVLEFLRNTDLKGFKEKAESLEWLTPEQVEQIDAIKNWDEKYPYLSRDAGAQILRAVGEGKMTVSNYPNGKKEVEVQVIGVIDNSDFAADSLFCEWAYVIDFDKNTFEVYKGFNKEPLDPSERFFHLTDKKDGEYYPVQHLKTYPLDELPTLGKFLEDLKDTDEEE